MSSLEQADQQLETVIRELAMRIVVPRMGVFDDLWEITNRIRGRYGPEKSVNSGTSSNSDRTDAQKPSSRGAPAPGICCNAVVAQRRRLGQTERATEVPIISLRVSTNPLFLAEGT
jgi:hypothetical protein